MWYPGVTEENLSLSSIAKAGSHFKFMLRLPSRLTSANIFPFTLNTSVSSPNGKLSEAPFFEMQYSRNVTISINYKYCLFDTDEI